MHIRIYIPTQFRALLTKHEWEKDPELVAAICQAAEKLVDVHRKYVKVLLLYYEYYTVYHLHTQVLNTHVYYLYTIYSYICVPGDDQAGHIRCQVSATIRLQTHATALFHLHCYDYYCYYL